MLIADLSHWNFPSGATEADVELALTRAKIAGLGAVLWKCTESSNQIDATYAWGQVICQKLGILFAGYHFFRNGDVPTQVNWYLSHANNPAMNVLDFEDGEVLGAEMFVDRVQKQTGRFPLLYTRASYISEKIGSKATFLSNCDLWVASYGNNAVLPVQWPTYALWQYTDAGKLDGFSSNVDLNRFNFALGDIASWWRGNVMTLVDARAVAQNDIPVYSGPGLGFKIVAWVKSGDTVPNVDTTSAKEDADNAGVILYEYPTDRWIDSRALQFASNVPAPQPTPAPPAPTATTMYIDPGDEVNVRSAPTVDGSGLPSGKVLARLPSDTRVDVYLPDDGSKFEWVEVAAIAGAPQVAGSAWISKLYLTTTAPKA